LERERNEPLSIVVLEIDLGKNVCSLVGLNEAGAVVLRRRLRRDGVADFVGNLPTCIVAMEAGCGAHHLGRVLGATGHAIRLMSPENVRPYVKANKNDDHDAEAIAEAATRPTMRFVPVKSEAQSDIQALHRVLRGSRFRSGDRGGIRTGRSPALELVSVPVCGW
jgi:transposase